MNKKILAQITILIILIIVVSLYFAVNSKVKIDNLPKSDINSQTYYNADHTRLDVRYSDGSGFSIKPPEPVSDWIFNNELSNDSGVAVSFYRKSGNDRSPIIYLARKVYTKDCDDSISGFIACDKKNFASDAIELIIRDLATFTTESDSKAYMVSYSIEPRYGQKAQYDEVAYIDAGGAVDMIVLTASSKEDLAEGMIAFNNVLESYKYLSRAEFTTDKKLKYVQAYNAGLVGYFDNGTFATCHKCDFVQKNINSLYDNEVVRYWDSSKTPELFDEDQEKPILKSSWVMVDYKWLVQPESDVN